MRPPTGPPREAAGRVGYPNSAIVQGRRLWLAVAHERLHILQRHALLQ